MRIKQYLRAVKRADGDQNLELVMTDLRRLEFKPTFFIITPRLSHNHDLFEEALSWLDAEYPGIQYAWAYDGLDWYFTDEMAAMHFKLRFG